MMNLGLSKKEYFIKDLVIDDEYGVIDSNATIQTAAKKMKELGVPDLVVVEEKSDKVLGVIADFDIIQNVVAKGSDPKEEMVISTMYKIKSMSLDDPVTEAFARMRDLNVNVVPVVENEKLVGVCTIQDCWSYIPDQDYDEVGLIPEDFGKGFWEDVLFSYRSKQSGFKLGITEKTGVQHLYHATFKAEGFDLAKEYQNKREIFLDIIRKGK